MFFYIFMCIIGFILLVAGADLLIRGASNIASKFHIPEMIIGLTIVAIGTSAPELIVTITSSINGNNNLIIGNAIGSNFCNLLLILGLMAVIRPIKIDDDVKLHDKVFILKDNKHILEVSNYLDTIPYEVLCEVGKRVKRVYR